MTLFASSLVGCNGAADEASNARRDVAGKLVSATYATWVRESSNVLGNLVAAAAQYVL